MNEHRKRKTPSITNYQVSQFQKIKDVYNLYEAGKKRRYDLLFAVNGGALAIAKLLTTVKDEVLDSSKYHVLGGLTLLHLAIGMTLFTIFMVWDIYAFGEKMRVSYLKREVFGTLGKIVLRLIGLLIILGWLLVTLNPKCPESIFINPFMIFAIFLLLADLWFPRLKRKFKLKKS
jgi:hypothetical protein